MHHPFRTTQNTTPWRLLLQFASLTVIFNGNCAIGGNYKRATPLQVVPWRMRRRKKTPQSDVANLAAEDIDGQTKTVSF
jgi:hypothetical protein